MPETGSEQISPRRAAGAPRSAALQQKLALAAALLLVIGFFVPWYSVSLKNEVDRAIPGFPSQFLSGAPSFSTSASQIQYGLGWVVLGFGLAAAAISWMAGIVPGPLRQRAILALLAAGAFVLVYVCSRHVHHIGLGLFLAMAGYGLQFAGVLLAGISSGPDA